MITILVLCFYEVQKSFIVFITPIYFELSNLVTFSPLQTLRFYCETVFTLYSKYLCLCVLSKMTLKKYLDKNAFE